jgi:hypothetical protein
MSNVQSDEAKTTEQVRGAVLAGIAALAGWSGITTISLLIQSSSLAAHVQQIEKRLETSIADQTRSQQAMTEEIRIIRKLIEDRTSGFIPR